MNTADEKSENPLLLPFPAPYGSVPFAAIKSEHFLPAFRFAISEAKGRVEKIKKEKQPNFFNTIVALETSGERVGLIAGVFFNLLGANSSDLMQDLAKEISPMLADFASDVSLDTQLFAQINTVYKQRHQFNLSTEQMRLLEKTQLDFVRNGANLNAEKKNELRAIDQELAKSTPEFSDNILKATNAFQLWIENAEDLKGLPEDAKLAAAQAAQEKGRSGVWLITLHAPSYIPFMTYAENRDLREKLWRAYNSRAFGDAFDNQKLVIRIAQLRYARAQILGFSNHAQFVLAERMAETPERTMEFLQKLLEKSKPAAQRDLQEVRDFKKSSAGDSDLMPWDYGFWAEKLKRANYDFDQELLRPYFPLEQVIGGAFEHARLLYDLKFEAISDVQTYHPDVKVFRVSSETNGSFVGLFYIDLFPRDSKRGGAWMTSYRDQGLFAGQIERPHISVVCNFTPPMQDKPSLLSFDEVRTFFHEFGHSLHGLLSQCQYTSLSGTNVYWDFVELPSQIMENWVLQKEGLDLFAKHWQTGEKMPIELATKIKRVAKFQSGYQSLRQINFALLDMAWHASDPSKVTDVPKFEDNATSGTRLLPKIEGINLSCNFSHVFSGGYSAGYYSYKWAEVLDADAFEAFLEKGLFNKEVSRSFRDNVLARGGTEHPMVLYKRFRGREPDLTALLKRDGLI